MDIGHDIEHFTDNDVVRETLRHIQQSLIMRRTVRGWSQRELANIINLSPSTVSAYESGIRIPNTTRLIIWADILGMEITLLDRITDDKD